MIADNTDERKLKMSAITMSRNRVRFLFLNAGHFLDHFLVLVFATAALRLMTDWGLSYAQLIPYATPCFIAFGLCAIPAGWLADKWSREGMMAVFFFGVGASSILVGMADRPVEISICLTLVGMFAAIYHPVGLAMVVHGLEKTGVPLAINGVFGNLGVASAALVTGFLVDTSGWRSAFFVPGVVSIGVGVLYLAFLRGESIAVDVSSKGSGIVGQAKVIPRQTLLRIFGIVLFTTAIGGFIFQSTTFALPKVFDERLTDIAGTATLVGAYAALVFAVAAFAQLVVGYLVDHFSVRTVFASVALLQGIFFFIMTQLEGIAALLVAVAFMLVVFGQIPINDVLVGRIARSEWRSRAYALRYIVSLSVSATAVPTISWIHGSHGFSMLFSVLSLAAFTIFVGTLFLPATAQAIDARASG